MKLKQKLDIDYGYYFEKGRSQSEPEEDQKENNPVGPSWLEPVKTSVIGGSTSSSILSDSAFDELSQELFLNQGWADQANYMDMAGNFGWGGPDLNMRLMRAE